MLPDWPELKRDINKSFTIHMRKRIGDRLGEPFSEMKHTSVFEGRVNAYRSSDGFEHETKMSKFSHDLVIHKSPAEVTLDDILITLEETAEKFAEDQSKMMLSTISDVCDKSGNVINAKQGADPLDQMMAVLEKIEIAFDENGKHNLTIVCGESLAKEYQQVFQKLANDPEAQRRHDEVMARKKVEWDAKQASRKLVG